MGALLGTAAGATSASSSMACCAGAMICQAISAFCKCASPAPATKGSGQFSKVIYLFVMLFSCLFALIMQLYGAPEIKMAVWQVGCDAAGMDPEACKGDGAVYRISMATFIWFATLMLGTIVVNEKIHNGYWGPKILMYILLVAGSFFIPNNVFGAGGGVKLAGNSGYALFARVVSSFFLVFQIIAFIDFAYKWNNAWVGKSDDAEDGEEGGGRKWLCAILASCATMYIIFIIWIIYLFATHGADDGWELVFITITAIGCIGITGLQLSISDTDGSLLTSAVVTLYCVYLCWSAISGAQRKDGKRSGGSIALSMAIAAFSLTYTCYSASVSATSITQGPGAAEKEEQEDMEDMRVPLAKQGADGLAQSMPSEEKIDDSNGDEKDLEMAQRNRAESYGTVERRKEDELEPIKERYWFFHCAMGSGAIYMAMLLTDWGEGGGATVGGGGETSMWVKMVSQWFAMALYTWTLLAPRFFPDRDFS